MKTDIPNENIPTPADYTNLDRPEVLQRIFHPRSEMPLADIAPHARDLLIPVAEDVTIGARFHICSPTSPNILFFHGNGEIVADYDDLGLAYNEQGINFLAVDYRGYGRSSGTPTVTAMMQDAHTIFDFTTGWLKANDFNGPLILMGRSLGSVSALELLASHNDHVDGLIIESGLALAAPLLQLLGVNLMTIDFREQEGFRNLDKIKPFQKPVLIIHAEFDHIIPFADGQALFDHCASMQKKLLKIPKANHNDIIVRGWHAYIEAIKDLVDQVVANTTS
jgi:pimeloyl-ACP methyl ester carboxylesterase